MTRYLALLRGINVGTSNRIRMDTLKRLFEEAGFSRVETYIQSGNVLFSSELPEEEARRAVETALYSGAQIKTVAVLRSAVELRRLLDHSPFSASEIIQAQRANTEGESRYVCLLPQLPAQPALQALSAVPLLGDRYARNGREIYLLLSQSIRTSKLALVLQKVLPDSTVRNWNTMSKLRELLTD